MYRVIKKTTKNTQYKCLDCKFCKLIDETKKPDGQYVECTAENKCFLTSFNARDYYCIEYKGFSEMTDHQKENVINDLRERERERKNAKNISIIITTKRQQRG